MILKIEINPENVIYRDDKIILVNVPQYAANGHGCHLATTAGYTVEDFHKNSGKTNKTVLVNQRGNIIVENNR